MIKYKLICKSSYCSEKNGFDGWFQNIEAFEKQKSLSLINCPICGSDDVVKSLTTPSLKTTKSDNSIQKKETNYKEIVREIHENSNIQIITKNKNDQEVLELLDELIKDYLNQTNLKKIESKLNQKKDLNI